MKFAFRGASSAALIIGITGGLHSAWAQQTATPATPASPQNQTVATAQTATQAAPQAANQPDQTTPAGEQGATDRVVITGSLIATTPEDAPKPVEVYTAEDLKAQGSPSVSEFVRSLTVNYGSDLGFGQSDPSVSTGSGFANADLRGLGSNATLVLMNGRRLASTNGGFGADLNTLPVEALEAVEILKDGASSTYGAGAVGGVINFRTRRDIDAPQLTVEKTMYDGSEGAYKIDFLTGWVGDAGNFMLSLSHSHEEEMLQTKRGFSSLPFNINPSIWTLTAANPGRFITSTNFHSLTPALGSQVNDYRAAADCVAVGGQVANVLQPGALISGSTTLANTGCAYQQSPFQSLVDEVTVNRIYSEFNADLMETMEVHVDVTYDKSESFSTRTPIDAPLNRAADGTISSTSGTCGLTGTTSCQYVIPVQVQVFTNNGASTTAAPATGTGAFIRNPFIDDFMTRTGVTAATLPATGALYTHANWRPFGFGGNPYYDDGLRRDKFQRERFLINAGVKGKFTGDGIFGILDGITYDYNAQYNSYLGTNMTPDVFVSRLQNALMGYGGPNCAAVDRVPTDLTSAATFNRTVGVQSNVAPGSNGCQWFNPFASGWATSVVTGAANPQFNAGAPALGAGATARPTGYANPANLIDWLIGEKLAESNTQAATVEATWTGELPDSISLPGGPIGWALGAQWRQLERRDFTYSDVDAAEETMNSARCPFPDPNVVAIPRQLDQGVGTRGCSTGGGAFFGTGRVNITLNTPPEFSDSQAIAYYGELQLPILDNWNLSASVRREDFNGGDLIGDIWNVASKYEIIDGLYVRGSYGTNFRAEAALDLSPGQITFSNPAIARFGNINPLDTVEVADNITPEDDKTLNIGAGYETNIGEGRLRVSVDFFEDTINGQVVTTSANTIYTNVFGVNTTAGQTGRVAGNGTLLPTGTPSTITQYADCQARLVSFLVFSAPCVSGVTTANNILQVTRFQQNGPGFVTNGFDYSADFSYPLFDGTFGASVTATQNLVYKAKGYDSNGVRFSESEQCLGFGNQSLGAPAGCSLSAEWRANGSIRWSNDQHNVNLRANFVSGVLNEGNPASLTTINVTTGAVSTYGVNKKDHLDFDFNYLYTAPFWKDLELRLTVLNIFDKDPMPTQNRSGYYTGVGNPRGRMVEIGATKKF